ncbi:hypothetical protein [Novosphingobium sp. ST904]|uniref:hypothetical protein n=1 Tax=Novosphingobium sp. ST904 TaxID=1684385 RepID=UPI0006C8E372|nr:hypothetical protein [Novosphingobium sp. ST904]KPH66907.1 hypothetical protein ADT71_03925 [Novosphingobium sp. ST904]TCM39157.1 hypothetical protein EDF59_10636 [Novosphingobium sp. ST904]
MSYLTKQLTVTVAGLRGPGLSEDELETIEAAKDEAVSQAGRAEGAAALATSAASSLNADAPSIGRANDPINGSTAGNFAYVIGTAVGQANNLRQIKLYARGAGTVQIARYTAATGGTRLGISSSIVIASAGLKTLTSADFGYFPVNPGEFLAIYANGVLGFTSNPTEAPLYQFTADLPVSGTATAVSSSNIRLEVQFICAMSVTLPEFTTTTANAKTAAAGVSLLQGTNAAALGRPIGAALVTGTGAASNNYLAYSPLPVATTITSVDIFAVGTGTLYFSTWSLSGGNFTRTGIVSAPVAAFGQVNIPINLSVAAGEYLCFYSATAIVAYVTGSMDSSYRFLGGTDTLTGPVTGGTARNNFLFQIRYNYRVPGQSVTAAIVDASFADVNAKLAVAQAQIGALQAQVAEGNYGGSAPIPLAAGDKHALLGSAGWIGIHPYGESLAMADYAKPALSNTQPYYNLTFGSGVRSGKPGNSYGAVNTTPGTSTTKPLIEEDASTGAPASDGHTTDGETIMTGMASTMVERAAIENDILPSQLIVFGSVTGHGGYRMSQLQKGASWYNNLIDHAKEAAARAVAAGKNYRCLAVPLRLGVNDAGAGTTRAAYAAAMVQLQADISADILAGINPILTAGGFAAQTAPVHMLFNQSGSGATIAAYGEIVLAQYDACNTNPARIHFVGPTHHLQTTADTLHETNVSQLRMGRRYGRAGKQLLVDGNKPDCIWPISAFARGATLRVKFRAPKFPLILNTALLGTFTDMGFKVTDDTGTLALTSFAISTSGDEVVITLDRTVTTNPVVRYGCDYKSSISTFGTSAGGPITDSTRNTTTISGVTYSEPHLAPQFDMKIIALQAQA